MSRKIHKALHYITLFGDDRPSTAQSQPPAASSAEVNVTEVPAASVIPNALVAPCTPKDPDAASAIGPGVLTGDNQDFLASDEDDEDMERDKRQGIPSATSRAQQSPSVATGDSTYLIDDGKLTCYSGHRDQYLNLSGPEALILEVDDMYRTRSR